MSMHRTKRTHVFCTQAGPPFQRPRPATGINQNRKILKTRTYPSATARLTMRMLMASAVEETGSVQPKKAAEGRAA
jgi:hypothetical protein